MTKYIFAIVSGLVFSAAFAGQSPNIAAVCQGTNLYWINANTTLKELREISKLNKLAVRQYEHTEDCQKDADLLNFQITAVDGNFLISANLKYYWIGAEVTLDDIQAGRILALNPIYAYSIQDTVRLPTKVNLPPFFSGSYHALVKRDYDKYNQARKVQQLKKLFSL